MPSFRPTVLPGILAILSMMITANVGAMTIRPGAPERPAHLLQVQRGVGPAGAAAAARTATGGRVLGVTSGQKAGRTVYRVKVLLPGGRMRTVTVDGRSGRVQR